MISNQFLAEDIWIWFPKMKLLFDQVFWLTKVVQMNISEYLFKV